MTSGPALSASLVNDLRVLNPWWERKPLPGLPVTRRHLVGLIHRSLKMRLAPITVVRGPRQIGKTTAQLQVLQDHLDQGAAPERIFRVQCDELPELQQHSEPILRLADWYQEAVLRKTFNEAAHEGAPAYLFLDEVQTLASWAPQLKFLVDTSTVQVVATGSSSFQIELGRDSLAGRITTLEAGTLSLTEIGRFRACDLGGPFLAENGLGVLARKEFWQELVLHGKRWAGPRDQVFQWFSDRGGYPLVHQRTDVEWEFLADQLNETVIRRVIQHDLGAGERGRRRDAALLEEVFRLACRYAGQSPGLPLFAREAKRALQSEISTRRIDRYLRFLADTLLLRLIEPLELRLKKRRGHPKICLADHGLRASWLQETIPLSPDDLARDPGSTPLAGHLAESVVGATLSTIAGLDIAHFPELDGEPEIDFVLTIGTRRIPLEVKYHRRIDPLRDTEGLRIFIEKSVNNAPFGLLITQTDGEPLDDPRIVRLPLSTLMLLR